MVSGNAVTHKPVHPALFKTCFCPGCRMVHLPVAVILNFILKCKGVLPDIMEHAARIAPVRFAEPAGKMPSEFSCSA